MIDPTWRNVARRIRPILTGQPIQIEVEGGWVIKPAPCDGYLVGVDGGGYELFLPLSALPVHPVVEGGEDE